MKYFNRLLFYTAVLVFVYPNLLNGQINISPRSTAVGGILGLAKEPFSIYLNPAGLSKVEEFYFALGSQIIKSNAYPAYFIGAVFPVKKDLIFGIGWKRTFDEKLDLYESEYILGNFYSSHNRKDENDLFYSISKSLSSKSSLGLIFNFKNRYTRRDSVYYRANIYNKQSVNSSSDFNDISLQLGFQYELHPKIRLGLLSGNLLGFRSLNLKINDELYKTSDIYSSLDKKITDVIAKLGAAFLVNNNLILLSDLNFKDEKEESELFQTGGLEYCYNNFLFFRISSMMNYSVRDNFFRNIAGGIGVTFRGFRLDYSFNQNNQYQLGLSYSPEMITKHVKIVQIEKITDNIYPVLINKYINQPIAYVKVFNSSTESKNIKAVLEIDKYINGRSETGYFEVPAKEIISIPLYAFFNDKINNIDNIELNDGTIKIYSDNLGSYQDKSRIRFIYHEKHSWNGNANDLIYYLTPSKQDIIRYTRKILAENSNFLSKTEKKLRKFFQAKILFNEFSKNISYINDPDTKKQMTDKVQFADETINLRSGDCEDLVVLYSTFLNSIGISTAFVDINYSETEQNFAHIYMLIDTEIHENDRNLVSTNEKRYIIRKSKSGFNTVWIPIETIQISNGFNKAWETGAMQFYQDYNIKLGKVKNWMKIIDVNK